jgi:hypothetical protein
MGGALAIALSTLTGGAMAAPLDLKQVAADSKWLAHVDVDALRASTVVRNAWHAATEKHKDIQAKLILAGGMLGMDLTKDIHGLTFYGKTIGKPQGVVIVAGQFDPTRLAALGAILPGRELATHGDYKIASWKHDCHGHPCTTAGTMRGKDQIVMAGSVDDLKAALDVLDGKAAGLTADSPLAGNAPPGTSFLLRVQGIKDADLPCKIPLVKETESFRMVAGEQNGQSFIRTRHTMTDPSVAALALQVVEGRKAEAALLLPDELGRKFMAAMAPKVEGSTITVLWSASADEVWQEVQKIEKLIEKHRARHKEHSYNQHKGHAGCPFCKMGGAESGKCPFCAGAAGGKPSPGAKKHVSPEEDF